MAVPQPTSLCARASALRLGELSPTQLVELCLARIDELEADLQAWVVVDRDGAFQQARVLEQQGWQESQPLWGLPIGIKDIIDVAGMPSRCGARWENDPAPATRDALVVSRLCRAGAIILGKTVTTEWACFDPPPTRNPYDFSRTPGGSSSGSAAAVATEMCVAALGTQTGGSILRPASFCGISGLKPSYRADFLEGVALVAQSLDHVGPMAATVSDLQVLWKVLNDEEPAEQSPHDSAEGIGLAVVNDPFLTSADDAVQTSFAAAHQRLRANFSFVSWELPISLGEMHAVHRTLMAFEAAQVHRIRFAARPDLYGASVIGLIQVGLDISATEYAAARETQRLLICEVQQTLPASTVLVMPTTLTPPPGRESTGDPRFNSPWSLLHLPAVTLPLGYSADGLPLGLQLIGKSERIVLAAGMAIENQVRGG